MLIPVRMEIDGSCGDGSVVRMEDTGFDIEWSSHGGYPAMGQTGIFSHACSTARRL